MARTASSEKKNIVCRIGGFQRLCLGSSGRGTRDLERQGGLLVKEQGVKTEKKQQRAIWKSSFSKQVGCLMKL